MDSEATVFVIDDDQSCCKSLRWLVESAGLRVATYESARQFLSDYDASMPGCVVLDVRMPGMSGIELQQHLRRKMFSIPVIIVTAYGDISMAVRAMQMGAVSFLEKPYSDNDLLDQIWQAIAADREIRQARTEVDSVNERLATLTQRERQVMDLVSDGLSNREIAGTLNVSIKTVDAHRARIMKKMRARGLPDLMRMRILADHN